MPDLEAQLSAKREELVFRGKQYMHAIELYGRKFANHATSQR
jgi:hypothetical protein